MILFQIKNLVVDSFSSLGLTVVSPLTINADALPYILYVTNFIETGDPIPMGRNQQTELTFDVMCTAKDSVVVQETIQKCYDYIMSKQFALDAIPVRLSSVTNYQNQDDYDPTSGLNTVVLSMRLHYITLKG